MINSPNQKTISKEYSVKGVGLHTGRKCHATFKPAPANSGIKFIRTDLPNHPEFKAHVSSVVDVIRGTTLGTGDNKVYTIEHILSALLALGIDNLIIEMDDMEPPVCDGSSKEFYEGLKSIGFTEFDVPKTYFSVTEPIEYISNQSVLRIEPSNIFEIECEIDYNHPLLKNQKFKFDESMDYGKEIAPAKTFCFDYEIEALKKKGLAKGGSLDNAIVVGPAGIYNPGSFLMFENEFVRHKILDLMGDLSLLGMPIKGKIIAKRCGHGHNVKFLRQLLETKTVSTTN